MRHNNFEADMLSNIVNDVETEAELQPFTGKIIEGLSGNSSRPDIRARGVWRASQKVCFNVRVTNTHSPSQIHFKTDVLWTLNTVPLAHWFFMYLGVWVRSIQYFIST